MNPSERRLGNRPWRRAWLWLALGFLLLPFTTVQTMLPLAAWLAPIFLLRFARTARRAAVALPLIFLAQASGKFIAVRGGEAHRLLCGRDRTDRLCLFGGLVSTLPYAADRLIGSRLDERARTLVFPLAFVTSIG